MHMFKYKYIWSVLKMSQNNFSGTDEQEKLLRECIAKHKSERGCLMPVLHEAQNIYGYLPAEVQSIIAEELNIPLSEVYGVATFYAQFSLSPKGENHVSVCLGTACYVKGSGDIINKVSEIIGVSAGATSADGRYSLDATRCIGACGLAPVMTVNNEVYGRLTVAQVPEILEKYM